MAVNDMTFNQLSTVLNSITQQATGAAAITPTNTGEFVSVAQTALKTGYDPVLKAISQVLASTIFSVRPYSAKFKGLMMTNQQYGNHIRKINPVDTEWENDDRIALEDGSSIDQQQVRKPKVLQTNFYGENVFSRHITIFKDQLDAAFSGPEQFGSFISMVLQNASDLIEQAHESVARATLANFMGGKIKGDAGNVIKLVTKYNDMTGLNLTADTVKKPENFVPFAKWAYAYVKTISDRMTERTLVYHVNVTGSEISRHTPKDKQKLYLYSPEINDMDASVLSSTYNTSYLQVGDFERVNFWQSIESPDGIQVQPTYMTSTGALKSEAMEMTQGNILGVLFDEEAVGMTTVNQWSSPAPFNARGGYTNMYWHFTDRYLNDFTENGVVLLLE